MREGEAGINMERVVVLNIVHASGRSRRHNLQPSFVCFDIGRSSVAKVTNRVGKQFPFPRGNCLSTAGKRFMCTGFPSSLSPEVKIKGDCVTCNQNFLCRLCTRHWMFLYQLSPRQSQAGSEICLAYQDSVST